MRLPRIVLNALTMIRFPGSAKYWDMRYRAGGDSGAGSYGIEAAYKTDFLNRCFADHGIASVIDFGCGDGNQLRGLSIERYVGYDVSPAAVARCRELYASDPHKRFHVAGDYAGETADAALSLDVLYHLVEQDVFDAYLARLFASASRIVVIYAVDREETRRLRGGHVRHRRFTPLVEQRFGDFRLVDAPPRPEHLRGADERASFFVYRRIA